jgi:dynamin 1-like protein
MDSDLIKLVNKLQDTFSNLGEHCITNKKMFLNSPYAYAIGGELDMPQLVVVSI